MTQFTVYDSATGEVQFSGTADDLEPLRKPGVTVVEELAPPDTYRDGLEWKLRPQPPSPSHVWNWTTKQWVDQRTIDDKWAMVRQRRDRIFANTVDRINALRWEEMTAKERLDWKEFRRALKEITLQPDPDNITWPVPPS